MSDLKYYYTESLGLVQNTESGFTEKFFSVGTRLELSDTPDEAKLRYYNEELKRLNQTLQQYTKRVHNCENTIRELNHDFDYLKKLFPERFI